MAATAIEEIEAWSTKLSPWRRDCLRRIASNAELSEEDDEELLAIIKEAAGFTFDAPAPTPVPFNQAQYAGASPSPVTLKGISNIQGVNRLGPGASINFCPSGLTVVYGRNGSGKSGYVRILRTACRSRVENQAKLKVLSNVYAVEATPQSADVMIDVGTGEVPIKWTPDCEPAPELAQVSVFDTASAQLYVDSGHQIRYLPFGLALPHQLNTVGLRLRDKLEKERAAAVGNKAMLTKVSFGTVRTTKAQVFENGITAGTTDEQIDAATQFEPEDESRLTEISRVLASGSAAVADLTVLVAWTEGLASEAELARTNFDDDGLSSCSKTRDTATAARQAAEVSAASLFTDDPLPGVGTETWRDLWMAARNYSVTEAYPKQDFPVVLVGEDQAECVLCQQPLSNDAAARMERFQLYMTDKLGTAAKAAETKVSEALASIPPLKLLLADDFPVRVEQVRQRDPQLADRLINFQKSAEARRLGASARLRGEPAEELAPLTAVHEDIRALASSLRGEGDVLVRSTKATEREKLIVDKAELEDQKTLAANWEKLRTRRDLLAMDAAYLRALSELQTRSITERANKLVDDHLTGAVMDRFDKERAQLDIAHLKVGLQRKSGQVKAEFQVDPQTNVTKLASDILSEGEQRALALAGFLTEVALTEGSGPIIIDDPVSSMDRTRSLRVAERLAEEAGHRQVVVFTHDIIFFNQVCGAADERGIEPVTVALFSDTDAAGKIDPCGMVWKGLNVAKRIGKLKSDFAPLEKLHASSPSDYEYQIKNLYGRLRDTYERVVEEVIFKDIVRRGADAIQTQLLRYVTLPDDLALRFHEGMTLANTHSHDNPSSDTVSVCTPDQFRVEIANLEKLVEDFKAAQSSAEVARPQMKPKK